MTLSILSIYRECCLPILTKLRDLFLANPPEYRNNEILHIVSFIIGRYHDSLSFSEIEMIADIYCDARMDMEEKEHLASIKAISLSRQQQIKQAITLLSGY